MSERNKETLVSLIAIAVIALALLWAVLSR
jgi:nitrogen fixation-related uncharacterized protein